MRCRLHRGHDAIGHGVSRFGTDGKALGFVRALGFVTSPGKRKWGGGVEQLVIPPVFAPREHNTQQLAFPVAAIVRAPVLQRLDEAAGAPTSLPGTAPDSAGGNSSRHRHTDRMRLVGHNSEPREPGSRPQAGDCNKRPAACSKSPTERNTRMRERRGTTADGPRSPARLSQRRTTGREKAQPTPNSASNQAQAARP